MPAKSRCTACPAHRVLARGLATCPAAQAPWAPGGPAGSCRCCLGWGGGAVQEIEGHSGLQFLGHFRLFSPSLTVSRVSSAGAVAARHFPEEPAGPDGARLPGRGLHLLCAQGTSQSSQAGVIVSPIVCWIYLPYLISSLVIEVHCQVTYNSEMSS